MKERFVTTLNISLKFNPSFSENKEPDEGD